LFSAEVYREAGAHLWKRVPETLVRKRRSDAGRRLGVATEG
jgi:hypothetical protein